MSRPQRNRQCGCRKPPAHPCRQRSMEITVPQPPSCEPTSPVEPGKCAEFCDVELITNLLVRQAAQQQHLVLEVAEGIAKLASCYLCPLCKQQQARELLQSVPRTGVALQAPQLQTRGVADPENALCNGNAALYCGVADEINILNENFTQTIQGLNARLETLIERLVDCCEPAH